MVRLDSMNTLVCRLVFLLVVFGVVSTACEKQSQPAVVILPTATLAATRTSKATPSPMPDSPSQIPIEGSVLRGVKINFWHPWSGKQALVIQSLIDEFNESNEYGINVTVIPKGGSDFLEEQVISAAYNGNLPEIIVAPITFLSALHENYNNLVNLNEFINNPQWGMSEDEVLSYSLTFWEQDIVDDFRVGLAAQRDLYLIFYNQTWAKELGFDEPPNTQDDFLNQACAAARANASDDDKENDWTGGWIYDIQPLSVLSWLKSFNGGGLPTKETIPYLFETSTNQNAFDFLHRIFRIDCAWVGREDTPYNYFSQRQALFYSGSTQEITIQEGITNEDQWTVIPYPSLQGDPIVLADGWSYGILRTQAEKQLAAWLLIKWLLSAENQARLIGVTGSLPLTNTTLLEMDDYRENHPVWNDALLYLPLAKPAPSLESWRIAGRVIQDAAWQLMQANIASSDISELLGRADRLIKDLIG